MKRSWLIQRLKRPLVGDTMSRLSEAFCFGGGGGRLSEAAQDLLRPLWSWDYMGAAEFEFGAVPEALDRMCKADLVAFALPDVTGEPTPDWRRPKGSKKPKPPAPATVYVIASKQLRDEVTALIRTLAAKESPTIELKASSKVWAALFGEKEWDRDVCGWLELDNGFLFFSDQAMFGRACKLFALEVTA